MISFNKGSGYISEDTVVVIGKSFRVGLQVACGEANITNLIIRLNNGVTTTFLDSGMYTGAFLIDKVLPKTVNQEDIWSFIVRDKNGKSASVSLKILADENSTYKPVLHFSSIYLGAQNNSDTGSFMDVNHGVVYNMSEAFQRQDSIDVLYYYDNVASDANTIASPNANIDNSVFPGTEGLLNWTIKNETRYLKTSLTTSDFSNISNDSILIASYIDPSAKRKAKNLLQNDVYSFKTIVGKYGMFRVIKVSGAEQGSIEIEIKIQK